MSRPTTRDQELDGDGRPDGPTEDSPNKNGRKSQRNWSTDLNPSERGGSAETEKERPRRRRARSADDHTSAVGRVRSRVAESPSRADLPGQQPTPRTQTQPARRRWLVAIRRALIAALITLILIAVGFGALAALSARTDLNRARQAATRATTALSSGELTAARENIDQAKVASDRAQTQLDDRALRTIGAVPLLGNSVDTSRAVGSAVDQVVTTADALVTSIEGLPDGLDSLRPAEGRIPVDAISQLAPDLETAAQTIDATLTTVEDSPNSFLQSAVSVARQDAIGLLRGLSDTLDNGAALARALPPFLGSEGPRQYFVAAQNPAEIRGSGGFLGVWSLLRVDDGRIEIDEFTEIRELTDVDVDDIAPPSEDFATLYSRFGGAGFWRNINMSPDVPVVSKAITNLYETTTGTTLDGVIFVDPFVMESAMSLTGSVYVAGFGEVTAENVVETVVVDAYRVLQDEIGSDARRDILGDVAEVVIERVLTGDQQGSIRQLLDVFGSAASDRHLFLYSTDAEEQQAFVTADLAGQLPQDEGDFLMVTLNNAAANKIDTFIQADLSYEVALQADGEATARLTTTLDNDALARAEPEYIIGPNVDYLNAGDSLLYVTTYCAQTCAFTSPPLPGEEGSEAGHPLYFRPARLRSGQAEDVVLDWTVGDAWSADGSSGTYRFTYRPQPLFRATQLDVAIRLPADVIVTDISNPDFRYDDDGTVRFVGDPRHTVEVEVTFTPG